MKKTIALTLAITLFYSSANFAASHLDDAYTKCAALGNGTQESSDLTATCERAVTACLGEDQCTTMFNAFVMAATAQITQESAKIAAIKDSSGSDRSLTESINEVNQLYARLKKIEKLEDDITGRLTSTIGGRVTKIDDKYQKLINEQKDYDKNSQAALFAMETARRAAETATTDKEAADIKHGKDQAIAKTDKKNVRDQQKLVNKAKRVADKESTKSKNAQQSLVAKNNAAEAAKNNAEDAYEPVQQLDDAVKTAQSNLQKAEKIAKEDPNNQGAALALIEAGHKYDNAINSRNSDPKWNNYLSARKALNKANRAAQKAAATASAAAADAKSSDALYQSASKELSTLTEASKASELKASQSKQAMITARQAARTASKDLRQATRKSARLTKHADNSAQKITDLKAQLDKEQLEQTSLDEGSKDIADRNAALKIQIIHKIHALNHFIGEQEKSQRQGMKDLQKIDQTKRCNPKTDPNCVS